MSSQPTTQQRSSINWRRVRLRPGALVVMAFLAGILLRPVLQHCLSEAGTEIAELLDNPANSWSGETLAYENPYTPSDQAMLVHIKEHDHPLGRATLTVIIIVLAVLGLRSALLLERR